MNLFGDQPWGRAARVDYLLLATTVALLVIGIIMVYSASFVVAHNEFNDDGYFLTRQLKGIAVGALVLGVATVMDYRRWRSLSLLAMLICAALLVMVLVPGIGSRSYGAVRWINIGSAFQLQPSEIAKITIVIYLADWLSRRGPAVRSFLRGSLPFAMIVVVIAGLIEFQPDLGTTFLILGIAGFIFFAAGANLFHIGILGCVGAAGGAALLTRLSGYQQGRITAFLDPWSDLQGTGWHTAQGLIALGSGGPFGVGLGGGLGKFYWVPNAHTDAIFAIIGEETGFIGCLVVLALFAVFTWRGFMIAWRARDSFGRLLATGCTSMIALQALVNIGVVTNSLPYTGVTLPFVSYGSSSVVISMFAVGLLLNVSRSRRQPGEKEIAETAEMVEAAARELESPGGSGRDPNRAIGGVVASAPRGQPRLRLPRGARGSSTGRQARPVRPRTTARRSPRRRGSSGAWTGDG